MFDTYSLWWEKRHSTLATAPLVIYKENYYVVSFLYGHPSGSSDLLTHHTWNHLRTGAWIFHKPFTEMYYAEGVTRRTAEWSKKLWRPCEAARRTQNINLRDLLFSAMIGQLASVCSLIGWGPLVSLGSQGTVASHSAETGSRPRPAQTWSSLQTWIVKKRNGKTWEGRMM